MANLTIPQYEAKADARFWSKVQKTETCWLWTGQISTNGYGVMTLKYPGEKAREVRAHRYLFATYHGPIAEGLDIDHKCHNKLCVRPAHLRATTRKQNLENRQGANSQSKSGVRGVFWAADKGVWRARVGHNGRSIYVGSFHELGEAEAAVIAKRLELHTHNDLDRRAA